MIFGFSLYNISLLATLVAYFRTELGDLADGEPPKGSKMCCCQYWRWILVLVNFQNDYYSVNYLFIY